MKELPIIAQIIFGLLLGTLLSLAVLIGVTYGAEAPVQVQDTRHTTAI